MSPSRPSSSLVSLLTALTMGFLAGCSIAGEETVVRSSSGFAAPNVAALGSNPSPRRFEPYAASPQPAEIRIPALDVRARVQPVGMSDESTMQVPRDIGVVGWFEPSAFPTSSRGRSVLVGHRDGAHDPNGVFRHLEDAVEGDLVSVVDLAGRVQQYIVVRTSLLNARQFSRRAEHLFATHSDHQLVLLTCGGRYDAARGGYQGTVVVIAERVDPSGGQVVTDL